VHELRAKPLRGRGTRRGDRPPMAGSLQSAFSTVLQSAAQQR
jgi:hypothetical protein